MNASYGQLPPITEGELLDIHLRRARVLTVSEDRRYIQVEAPNAYRLVLDRAKVAIDRIAPAEWPPHAGDIWRDGSGDAWAAFTGSQTGLHLVCTAGGGNWMNLEEALAQFGPMTLEYRRGWTPDEKQEPVEVDERAAIIAGLRAFADRLEGDPFMPTPANIQAPAYVTPEEIRGIAVTIGAKVNEDNGAITGDLDFGLGTGELHTAYLAGAVRYYLYAKPPATPVVDESTIYGAGEGTWIDPVTGLVGGGLVTDDSAEVDVNPTLTESMRAAGLRIVAGPGPLREVLPEALDKLTGLEPRQDTALVDDGDVDRWEHEGGHPLVDDGDPAVAAVLQVELPGWVRDFENNQLAAGEPRANCTAWLTDGAAHTHTCALFADAAPHNDDHICVEDGCGRTWPNDGNDSSEVPNLPADLGQHDETDVTDRGIL